MNKEKYKEEITSKIESIKGIKYGENKDLKGRKQNLLADLYMPADDKNECRPLILFLHGGAFAFGSRGDFYSTEFCKSFSKLGYVTASLDYRLGVSDAFNPVAYGEAIYRSVQDAKAAIRFFRSNASRFGVNPDLIFIGGGSAGAIAALHAAYWRQEDVPFYLDTQKLGLLSGNENDLSDSVQGVINCWGALIGTEYIRKGDAPVVSIHGENDPVVPYRSSSLGPFSLSGSYFINQRALQVGVRSVLQAFPNTGHGFSSYDRLKWETSATVIRTFLYELVSTEKHGTANMIKTINSFSSSFKEFRAAG